MTPGAAARTGARARSAVRASLGLGLGPQTDEPCGYSGSWTMARVTRTSCDPCAGRPSPRKPLMTHACRPRQTSSPTGLPVSAMATAAVSHGLLERAQADEPVRAGTQDVEAGGPAADARALALCWPSGRGRSTSRARFWSWSCGARPPIGAGLDHVEHHLHARADALDEVRLCHVSRRCGRDVHAVAGLRALALSRRDAGGHRPGQRTRPTTRRRSG